MSLFVRFQHTALFIIFLSLAACGGGSSDNETISQTGSGSGSGSGSGAGAGQLFIAGGGIKGPLAFASVELYALDARLDQFYDPANPLAVATTNAYAQITGLPVPSDVPPPYILVIDGTNAIDLNTGVAPVLNKLVTVITREALNAGQPIFATPYTTLAYHMLRDSGKGSIQQSTGADGLISIEAEDYDASRSRGGHSWVQSFQAGYAGTGALEATPNDGTVNDNDYVTESPRLDYKVNFVKTGVHYVWIRGLGPTGRDDSLYVGLNGAAVPTAEYISGLMGTEFRWTKKQAGNVVATVNIASVGEHTLNLWMREDGAVVDKILLTTNLSYSPDNTGPSSSPRSGSVNFSLLDADTLANFGSLTVESLGFGMSGVIDVFTTPPILTDATTTTEDQQQVVQYRAAIEALSTLLNEISLSVQDITSDELLEMMGFDLYDDGMLNTILSMWDIAGLLAQDPMTLQIANTQYQVKDIVPLMQEERALVGDSVNAVYLLENVDFNDEAFKLQPISAGPAMGDTNSISTTAPTDATNSTSTTAPTDATTSTSITAPTDATSINSNASGPNVVLNVNFNNHPIGPYTKQDAIDDFDADQSTGPGWTRHTNDSDVVRDPTGDPKRGNVMRVTHYAGKGGGGPRFKARLPVKDEYYLSYDVFIPKSNDLIQIEKIPGLYYGSMLEASHAYQVKPTPEGVKSFAARFQFIKPGVYTARGNTNQLTTYIYDADRVQYNRWTNLVDPVNSPAKSTWNYPKGRWVKLELRVKQNTATSREGVGYRRDGILQAWVDGKLAVNRRDMRWRTINTMRIDGISMSNYYGGDPRNPQNKPSKDQYTYFDNFIVSTSPITH